MSPSPGFDCSGPTVARPGPRGKVLRLYVIFVSVLNACFDRLKLGLGETASFVEGRWLVCRYGVLCAWARQSKAKQKVSKQFEDLQPMSQTAGIDQAAQNRSALSASSLLAPVPDLGSGIMFLQTRKSRFCTRMPSLGAGLAEVFRPTRMLNTLRFVLRILDGQGCMARYPRE